MVGADKGMRRACQVNNVLWISVHEHRSMQRPAMENKSATFVVRNFKSCLKCDTEGQARCLVAPNGCEPSGHENATRRTELGPVFQSAPRALKRAHCFGFIRSGASVLES